MAVNLSVKKVPEDLVQRLRARAEKHQRSLQKELMAILEEAAGARPISFRELSDEVRALGLKTPSQSVAMVREDRDAR